MSDNVTLKDLRETFYKCRNFELNHLWQRSVFLTAFLLACFTGYGHVVKEIIKLYSPNKSCCVLTQSCDVSMHLHEIAAGIALVGIVFSIIWIMMAKASKAWYEVYEKSIGMTEDEPKLGIDEKYVMGAVAEEMECDSNLFTGKAGRYSPSKLNIFIGLVLFIIWITIFIAHITILANRMGIIKICIKDINVFYILLIVFAIVLFTAFTTGWARSKTLG